MNSCFEKSSFPDELKVAIVDAAFEGGNKYDPNNYRPLARAPILSKVYEASFMIPWTEHLNKNRIINDAQFGFVEKSNTETALIHLLSNVYSSIESKLFAAVVFIDC